MSAAAPASKGRRSAEPIGEDLVGIDIVAGLLKLEPRRIQQLAAQGILPKASRGKYELVGCVQGYIEYLRAGGAGRGTTINIAAERARLVQNQAELAEITVREARGELVPVDLVVERVGELFDRVRSRVLTIPGRYAAELARLKAAPKVKAVLQEAVRECLEELSSGDDVAGRAASEGARRVRKSTRSPTR